jgi:hypothetical protein
VKVKTLLLFVSFACLPAVSSFGQVNCNTSTKLVCQFPFSAQTLGVFAAGSNSTSALAQAAEAVANPINASIATQLTQLPIPSATVGVVTLQKKGSEFGTTFDNLGPVLTDRPDTVGKGHIFAGFSYQHFNFNALAGQNLSNIPVGFNYVTGNVTSYYAVNNQVSFQLDQYVGIATYGATRRTDTSSDHLGFSRLSIQLGNKQLRPDLFPHNVGFFEWLGHGHRGCHSHSEADAYRPGGNASRCIGWSLGAFS